MFANIDTDNSGTITYEELKEGLAKLGSKIYRSRSKVAHGCCKLVEK